MSPRPYRLGQRQLASEETRARIVAAARELLAADQGFAGITVDAVARQAGVARMTVYYQFGSKDGMLQSLFDYLGTRGGMGDLAGAFGLPDPLDGLAELVEVFSRFWASDRLVIRRLYGLAAIDADLESALRDRNRGRRAAIGVLLRRVAELHGRPAPDAFEETVDVIHVLTGFEVYDRLATAGRGPERVAAIVRRLVLGALDR